MLMCRLQGLPARDSLDQHLCARRCYRRALQRRTFWAWRRDTHMARMIGIRWVIRDGRRVALRRDEVSHPACARMVAVPGTTPPTSNNARPLGVGTGDAVFFTMTLVTLIALHL